MYGYGDATMSQKIARESSQISWQHAEKMRLRMEKGPYIEGALIVIPSEWFSERARAFWRSKGFKYVRSIRQWQRQTRMPHEGKVYSAQAWLQSARRKFFEFFPVEQEARPRL